MFAKSRQLILAPLITGLVAVVLVALVRFGNDTAAHLYLTALFAKYHRLIFWDNFWYFGKFQFLGYSYIYYPLAAFTTTWLPPILGLMAISGVVSSFCLKLKAISWNGVDPDRPGFLGSYFGTISTAVAIGVPAGALILTGAYPFLTSLAFASFAIVAMNKRSWVSYCLFLILAGATSPLVLVWILVGVTFSAVRFLTKESANYHPIKVAGLGSAWLRAKKALGVLLGSSITRIGMGLPLLGLFGDYEISKYFGIGGKYPFFGSDLGLVLGFSLILLVVVNVFVDDGERAPIVIPTLLYMAGSLILFTVSTTLGGNIARVGEISPILIAVLYLFSKGSTRGPKSRKVRLAVFALLYLLGVGWEFISIEAPIFDPSAAWLTNSSNWSGLVRVLKASYPGQRVEYVDSLLHEGSYFLANSQIPLARGWFRQSDFNQNEIFYGVRLTSREYKDWLCSNQVRAVILPPAPYDYSSQREAQIVASPSTYLVNPIKIGEFKVFEVAGCPSAPLQIRSIGVTTISVSIAKAGSYLLPINFSPFESAVGAKIARAKGGRAEISVSKGGNYLIMTGY
ncbi:hypothetical protein [Acidithrix sp. C25]|uniref:hypothetical protein n=1 Tax=Acidithrix sp. C25 TaxID=1671482 RepID=UPI00191BB98E|nr:hypothetical protein [Acidithrix sp. C25]CAG4918899.1 unnamed protein product [Acidithrix sp. C25]